MWHDRQTKDENWGLQETITKMLKWVQRIISLGCEKNVELANGDWCMSVRNGEILNWDFN